MTIEEIRSQDLTLTDEEIVTLKSNYRRSTLFSSRELIDSEELPEVTFNVFNLDDFKNIPSYLVGILRKCDDEKLLKTALKACLKEIEILEEAFDKEDSFKWRDQIANILSELYEVLGYMLVRPSKEINANILDFEVGFTVLPYSAVAKKCNLLPNNKEAEKYLLKALMYNPSNYDLSYFLGCFYLFNCKKDEFIILEKASDFFIKTRDGYSHLKDEFHNLSKLNYSFINPEIINYCGCVLYDNNHSDKALDMFMYAYELDKENNHRLKDRNAYVYNLALYYFNESKEKYLSVSQKVKYKVKGKKYLKELEKIVNAKGMTIEEYIKDPINDPDGIIKEYSGL